MKKLFKTAVIFSMAAILIVVGAYAASSLTFDTNSSEISFTSNSVYVQINCKLDEYNNATGLGTGGTSNPRKAATDFFTYNGTSTNIGTPKTSAGPWDMGNLDFVDDISGTTSRDQFIITMEFTNRGSKAVKITFAGFDTTAENGALTYVTMYGGLGSTTGTEATLALTHTSLGVGASVKCIFIVKLKTSGATVPSGAGVVPKIKLSCTIANVDA